MIDRDAKNPPARDRKSVFGALLSLGVLVPRLIAADPVPDFSLVDVGSGSPRRGQTVSPGDYRLQVSAYYFASATCGYCRTQFGYLDSLQKELRQESTSLNIELLGVNRASDNSDFANQITTIGRTLPWLQDTAEANVYVAWGINENNLRDVRIVDHSGRQVAVYNLTLNSLEVPANREHLKELLRTAANPADSDADGLPDPWELHHAQSLRGGASADPDGDGYSNFLELAFGTDPADALSFPLLQTSFNSVDQFQVSFNRWAGGLVHYTIEVSTNLVDWVEAAVTSNSVNLYDGTGRTRATHTMIQNTFARPVAFIRLNAHPLP